MSVFLYTFYIVGIKSDWKMPEYYQRVRCSHSFLCTWLVYVWSLWINNCGSHLTWARWSYLKFLCTLFSRLSHNRLLYGANFH